ncbi:hypothetical protein [Thalassoglobus polymorphus]|uniref:Uncharacterized protein n=1 Tax=Thalassoglobus polymorphus TaxID=2527994 RepID=A0A517QVF2_9PLAN|nr:hypothetical protein [Thalassoglobus polymorphus]QDT35577.1 hypothetical protein Mal48_48550 [Thalassoglobus polymorphus]
MSRSDQAPPVISNSTILILSSFLIGMATNMFTHEFVSEELSPFLLAGGTSGVIAFYALDLTSTRRSHAAIMLEQNRIEDRLDKHMNSLTSVGFTMDDVSSKEMNAIDPAELVDATERNERIVTSI